MYLAVSHGAFLAMLDLGLFLLDESWAQDRDRCIAAHVPHGLVHQSKWEIAPEQIKPAAANGVRFNCGGLAVPLAHVRRMVRRQADRTDCCLSPRRPTNFGGKNQQVTLEQTARALNEICRQ